MGSGCQCHSGYMDVVGRPVISRASKRQVPKTRGPLPDSSQVVFDPHHLWVHDSALTPRSTGAAIVRTKLQIVLPEPVYLRIEQPKSASLGVR